MDSMSSKRVALVHDWINGYRGGEKVLHALADIFPHADIFTLFYVPGSCHPDIERHRITASWMNRLPGVQKRYRTLLPLFPGWADGLDLRAYDLVVSTSHCVAKGARARDGAKHLCYCHTPMRYVWDRFDDYFGGYPAPLRALLRVAAARLRRWDRSSASRVDYFLANSHFVRRRILQFYGVHESKVGVLNPPVDFDAFAGDGPRGERIGRYLVVSALVPYKRIDVAVEACARSGRSLTVAGTGPELDRLRRLAQAWPEADIEFRGFVPDAELPGLFATHRALLFPGIEDFGITPLEATAAGLPVIALGEGGVLDSVLPGLNGLFYEQAGVEGMMGALDRFEAEARDFDPVAMREHAEGFDRAHFVAAFQGHLEALIQD